MGNKASAPSSYLKMLWLADEEVDACLNCHAKFTMTKRKHHCRCCGSIFCNNCWGKKVALPPEYGFPNAEPVCLACYELFQGRLMQLREQRCVVVTFALRTKTGEDAIPPLAPKNVQAKAFKLYYMKVARWRPFDANTHLQFCTKPDSSSRSPRNGGGNGGFVPRASNIDTSDPIRDEEDGFSDGGGGGGRSSVASSREGRRSITDGGAASGDVAFTVPLNSILHVVFDHHNDGDYLTLETAQQNIRLQCVELSDNLASSQTLTAPASDQLRVGSGNSGRSEGGGSTASRKVKKVAKLDINETLKLYTEAVDAVAILHGRTRGEKPYTATPSGSDAPTEASMSRGSMVPSDAPARRSPSTIR